MLNFESVDSNFLMFSVKFFVVAVLYSCALFRFHESRNGLTLLYNMHIMAQPVNVKSIVPDLRFFIKAN